MKSCSSILFFLLDNVMHELHSRHLPPPPPPIPPHIPNGSLFPMLHSCADNPSAKKMKFAAKCEDSCLVWAFQNRRKDLPVDPTSDACRSDLSWCSSNLHFQLWWQSPPTFHLLSQTCAEEHMLSRCSNAHFWLFISPFFFFTVVCHFYVFHKCLKSLFF